MFELLSDLRAYRRWLPASAAYHGTLEISPGPIGIGTTYVEPGPFGTRFGRVTDMVRPFQLDFEQPMRMRPSLLGVIDIRLFHRLSASSDTTTLTRSLELSFRGPVRVLKPVFVRAFVAENNRMMAALKAFAEGHPAAPCD